MNQNRNSQEYLQPQDSLLQNESGQPEDSLQLEEVLAQVERCIAYLENPQISLEDSFRYYEEGIRRLRICNEKVDRIEKQMLVLSNQGELEDFGVL